MNTKQALNWLKYSKSAVAPAWIELIEEIRDGFEHGYDDFYEECDYLIMDGQMTHEQKEKMLEKLEKFIDEK